MKKHFFTLLLLIILVALARPAQARLTLGVVVDQVNAKQAEQLPSLVKNLSKQLQDEVSIKEMSDLASLVNWMDQYAAIDLALLSDADIKAYRGRFLLVGPLDRDGQVNLVARQGVSPRITQKAAEFVKAQGFSPWRPSDDEGAFADTAAPAVTAMDQPLTIDSVIEKKVPTQKAQARVEMVLAVINEPGGLLQSTEQAAGLADYLGKQLPLDIKIKEFARLEQFAEWFMRFRMVDLAVVPKTVADSNLGRDYIAIAELVAEPGTIPATELLVGRRGDHPTLQEQLRGVLLSARDSTEGQSLLAGLAVQSVRAFAEQTILEEPPAEQPLVSEIVAKSVPTEPEPREAADDLPEPVMPVLSESPVVQPVQDRPELVSSDLPPEPAMPDLVPVVPQHVPRPALTGPPAVAMVEPPQVAATEPPGQPIAAKLPETRPPLPKSPRLPGSPEAPVVAAAAAKTAEEIPEPVGKPPVEVTEPVEPVKPTNLSMPARPELQASPENVVTPVSPTAPVVVALPTSPMASNSPPEMIAPKAPTTPEVAAVSPPVDSAPVPVVEAPALEVVKPVVPVKPEPAPEVSVPVVTSIEPTPPAVVSLPQPVETTPEEEPQAPEPVIIETVIAEPPAVSVAEAPPAEIAVEESPIEQQVVEETLADAEPVAVVGVSAAEAEIEQQQPDIIALLGEDSVAAIVAQPEIPQELRPPGIPVVRPGRILEQSPPIDEGLFLTSLPEEIEQKEPEQPPQLLPAEEQDSGIIYIIPFVAIMVPKEVNDRIFDQFIDALIKEGEKLELQIVILKEGLKNVNPQWLKARKYVTGEIYAYVEEAGSTAIDLRAKAKLNYHTPRQVTPTFSYLHPVTRLLDPDVSTIEEERKKLADDIAETLITQFLNALQG